MAGGWNDRLGLLVLQPTPFCNLDCSYCYLPDRDDRRQMSLDVIEATLAKLAQTGGLNAPLSIVWHAGEPTVVARSWYARAFEAIARYTEGHEVHHHFQTNAVLVDEGWCRFFLRHDVRVGVSIDGPAFLHDAHRRNRNGRGTHDRVMRGVARLREMGVPFHAICVLTRPSLSHADVLFDFFATLGASAVGFNVEEAEAVHAASSLQGDGVEEAFRRFFSRIVQRWQEAGETPTLREVESVKARLRSPRFGQLAGETQNQAGGIVNVGWDGSFATWSPELLGVQHPRWGRFVMGNVLRDPLPPLLTQEPWDGISAEIELGVQRCRESCRYFDLCLGGAPSNKLGEHGRFDVTETMHCRLSQQVVTDVVLAMLADKYLADGEGDRSADA